MAENQERDRLAFKCFVSLLIVFGGLYLYLSEPNFMDQTWAVSFALSAVLLFEAVSRSLAKAQLWASVLVFVFLSWNFIAGMRNFWIYALGMEYHGIVIRSTLLVILISLYIFRRLQGNTDLKILLGGVLLVQIIGAAWAANIYWM